MTDTICDLLISLSSHMAYMQGQLEARHELDDFEDFYWYRESVLLRQKVTDALADEPAVSEGREPASVTEQPSDEEIMGLMPQQMHEDLAYAARAMANEAGTDNRKAKGFMRIALNRHAVDLARAVLARWGNPAPLPPAKGEVAELVRRLKMLASWRVQSDSCKLMLRRAAELLERLSPPQPVPVSELSPAAQAVLDAAEPCVAPNECPGLETAIAAALRAAADQVVPQGGPFLMTASEDRVRHQLLAIADELENHQ